MSSGFVRNVTGRYTSETSAASSQKLAQLGNSGSSPSAGRTHTTSQLIRRLAIQLER